VEIVIDATPLHFGDTSSSTSEIAVGQILYEPGNPEGPTGILVYLKPAVNANMPIDVLAFRQANPDFPNHTTLNQWFLESHFESYRALGYAIGDTFVAALKAANNGETNVHLQAKALLSKLRQGIGVGTQQDGKGDGSS